jgi:hydrogenase maturation protease
MAPLSSPILIAGLGNELLTDDGVGIHACRLLRQQAAERGRTDVVIAEIGTAIWEAIHLLEQATHVLAIDAMQAGGAPGTLYRATPAELEPGEQPVSLHELSLLGALQLVEAERLGALQTPERQTAAGDRWTRPRIDILGVEPASLRHGLELSGAVSAALPRVAAEAWRIIDAQTATAR